MIFAAGQNQRARSLVVIVTHCFKLGTKKKKKQAGNGGDSINGVTRETVPSIPCMGSGILYFP